jgi:hypothetical protein
VVHYAGSVVELLATGGDCNAAATPVFFSALLRKPGEKEFCRQSSKQRSVMSLPLSFCLFAFSRSLSIARSRASSESTMPASTHRSYEDGTWT